jgi:hypothetical protein
MSYKLYEKIIPVNYLKVVHDFAEGLISRDTMLISFSIKQGIFILKGAEDYTFHATFKISKGKQLHSLIRVEAKVIRACFENVSDYLPPGIPVKKIKLSQRGKDFIRGQLEQLINHKTKAILKEDTTP